jgi:antirestriction protein ArdC
MIENYGDSRYRIETRRGPDRARGPGANHDFRIGGSRAFYVPAHDYVQVPPPQAYFEPINWHRTALHELGHASGAPHRLNRDLSGASAPRSTRSRSWWRR